MLIIENIALMNEEKRKIKIGITSQEFEQGAHICQIFSSDEERNELLNSYIISGLKDNENTACFSNKVNEDTLSEFFEKEGISIKKELQSENFSSLKTSDIYFENEELQSKKMLTRLTEFYKSSITKGYNGARVIGEMDPKIDAPKYEDELLRYECEVSLLAEKYPVTAVCQYDVRDFKGSTIMEILKVHPYIIVGGSIVNNPFYIKPKEYLAKLIEN